MAVTRIPSLVLRNTWHYVIIRYSYGELPKFVLPCSYEAALRKGVTTASHKTLSRNGVGTWLPRGSYGVYVAVTGIYLAASSGSSVALTGRLPRAPRNPRFEAIFER